MEKTTLKNRGLRMDKRGFTFIEIMITFSLFLILASVGVGSYFQYYTYSLITRDVDKVTTIMQQTRFRALKTPDGSDYGIHLNDGTGEVIGFKSSYTPGASDNITVTLEQLNITDLDIQPDSGTTNEILFEASTGKTANTGSFTIGDSDTSYTFNINVQGGFE